MWVIITDSTMTGDVGAVGPFSSYETARSRADSMAEQLIESLGWVLADESFQNKYQLVIASDVGANDDAITLSIQQMHHPSTLWLP